MSDIVLFATLMYAVQLAHSIEELKTGFHTKWFLFKMRYRTFLTFEIVHNLFWLMVLTVNKFPYREELLVIFIFLMFVNGMEHVIWALHKKTYVPGLITAPLHIGIFSLFCFQLLVS